MSDTYVIVDTHPIEITVNANPIQITAIEYPNNITASFPGVQGPPGTGASANTGILTGAFYPLNSNPAGYVTSSEGGTAVSITGSIPLTGANFSGFGGTLVILSGNYVLISGAGGSSVNTGILTGAFYPLIGNPSGFIMGGPYYLSSNPSGFITGFNSGQYVVTGQTGIFATAINLQSSGSFLQSTITGLQSWTGISTGLFYPYSSNPNNYVTTSQTGILATTGNLNATGVTLQNAINSINNFTGNFTLNSNTGAFIATGQTGAFYASSNPNNYITYAQVGGVTYFTVTGYNLSGALTLTGISGITVTTGNASTIIVGINTGLFYSSSNPSNFITPIQSGLLTGAFYPLNTNPSSYITASQTGIFVTTGQTGVFARLNSDNLFTGTNTFSGNVLISGAPSYYLNIAPNGGINIGNSQFSDGRVFGITNYTVNWQQGTLLDNGAATSLDWGNRLIYDEQGNLVASWLNNSCQLISPYGNHAVLDWGYGQAEDDENQIAISWINRYLFDNRGQPYYSLDWGNKILFQNWTATGLLNTSGLQIQGNNVVTGGPYYLNSNPSGFNSGVSNSLAIVYAIALG